MCHPHRQMTPQRGSNALCYISHDCSKKGSGNKAIIDGMQSIHRLQNDRAFQICDANQVSFCGGLDYGHERIEHRHTETKGSGMEDTGRERKRMASEAHKRGSHGMNTPRYKSIFTNSKRRNLVPPNEGGRATAAARHSTTWASPQPCAHRTHNNGTISHISQMCVV